MRSLKRPGKNPVALSRSRNSGSGSTAVNQRTAIWLAAADQTAVTQATHRLEQALSRHPFAVGIPRNATVNRTVTDLPLRMDYEIIEDDRVVRILRVWSLV
jgi:hypothetical protein